jgi:hypothetical protein
VPEAGKREKEKGKDKKQRNDRFPTEPGSIIIIFGYSGI